MKKMLTLVLVAVMVAMTCLPAFAAIDANGDIVCDKCRRHDQLDLTGEEIRSFNRLIPCPLHNELHDAEEWYVISEFHCYRCDKDTYEFTHIEYDGLF